MKLQRIVINWKLGDHKLAHSKSCTQVFIKDSLYNNTETIGYYSIKVIDTVKNYTILYSSEPQSIEINTKSSVAKLDSGIKFFTDIIKKVEKETQSFKYELLIDKSTGLAFKVKNGDSFLKAVEQACATIIQESGERMKKPSKQIDSIKQKINTYFKDAQVKVLETMLNQFNYIMQPYSYEFPYNTTISQKTMVHDVNTLGTLGDVEIPAILTISSKKVNNILTIKTITDYDKAFMLAQIKKKYKNTSHLTTSDIFLSEKTEATFLTKSGWIVSHKSNVIFDMKEVKVINETVVSFQ